MNEQKTGKLHFNNNFSLPSKSVSVPKEVDRSPYMDLMASGYASEMLIVEFSSGSAIAYPYHLLSKISFEPTKQLLIQFNDESLRVLGTNLIELFRHLTSHRVSAMRELPDRGFDIANDKLCIKKIELVVS